MLRVVSSASGYAPHCVPIPGLCAIMGLDAAQPLAIVDDTLGRIASQGFITSSLSPDLPEVTGINSLSSFEAGAQAALAIW